VLKKDEAYHSLMNGFLNKTHFYTIAPTLGSAGQPADLSVEKRRSRSQFDSWLFPLDLSVEKR
jgi:hypothetical protein